jgi:polar amino acid transport system ATP-binding protein
MTVTDITPVALEVHGVHKWYGTHRVLDGVDLTVRPGEVTVILGPSGSGKSTLLRVINHLEKPEIGHVSVNDELIGARRQGDRLKELSERAILTQRSRIGFVFQNFNLFPHLTVLDNVAAAPVATGKLTRTEAKDLARELLGRVGLADCTAPARGVTVGAREMVGVETRVELLEVVDGADLVTTGTGSGARGAGALTGGRSGPDPGAALAPATTTSAPTVAASSTLR